MKKILLTLLALCVVSQAYAFSGIRLVDEDGVEIGTASNPLVTSGGSGGVSSGCLEFAAADGGNDEKLCNTDNNVIEFQSGGETGMKIVNNPSFDQTLFTVGSGVGRQIVIGAAGFEAVDFDHALGTNPVLYIHSSTNPNGDNTEWISMSHNASSGFIQTGKGSVVFDSAGGTFALQASSTTTFNLETDTTTDQVVFSLEDASGNQIVIGTDNCVSEDFDHAVQTDPTMFFHSDTCPDSNNTQWLSITHNKTNGIITTGAGDLDLSGASGDVQVDGTLTLEGGTNNCILTVDADGTCDAGTAMVVDNSIAVCAVCAAN